MLAQQQSLTHSLTPMPSTAPPPASTILAAACCGDLQRVTALLQSTEATRGAEGCAANGELFELDRQGYSAAAWACCHDDLPILVVLLAAAPSFLTLRTHNGASLLHLVCLHKSLRCLDHLLTISQTQTQDCRQKFLDATNHFQETSLHLAAGIGHVQTVEQLIAAGAGCLLMDQYGRSPHTVS